MRKVLLSLAVVAWAATPALAAVGETWILLIHHYDDEADAKWVVFPEAGYLGTDALGRSSWSPGDPVPGDWRRIYWELSGAGSMDNDPPEEVRLYTIEFYDPDTPGPDPEGGTWDDWQPIESQMRGAGGETYPIDPDIPWAGAYGTNHQYIQSEGHAPPGDWEATGPGHHTPESEDYNAGPLGIYMWLKRGSWVYAKWDFNFGQPISRAWSALRLTQVTPPGACCLPDLTCEQLERTDCEALNGEYRGNLTYCDDPDIFCCPHPFADVDLDYDVDQDDFGVFQACYTSDYPDDPDPAPPPLSGICLCLNRNLDEPYDDVDGEDLEEFEKCATGPGITFDPEDESTWPGYGTEDACEGVGYPP